MSVKREMARFRRSQDIKRTAAGLPSSMDTSDIPDDVKAAAIEAHSEAMRMGMLRVGNPWVPIALAILAASRK